MLPQILFAAVVLGVSVSLATQFNKLQKDCNAETKDSECKLFGMIPAIEYSAFVGAFGLLDALIGLAGCFLEMIPYLVTVGFDALADIFYIAGGVVRIWRTPYPQKHLLSQRYSALPSSSPTEISKSCASRTVSVVIAPASKQIVRLSSWDSLSRLFSWGWALCGSVEAPRCIVRSEVRVCDKCVSQKRKLSR